MVALAERRDRALVRVVEVDERAARALPGALHRFHTHAELAEPVDHLRRDVVVAERGVEDALARQPCELNGRHGTAARGLDESVRRLHDLAGARHALDANELSPLEVADYSGAKARNRGSLEAARVTSHVAARRPHVLVPARAAARRVAGGVEAQPGDHREGMAAVRVDGDPLALARGPEALELARVLGAVEEASAVQRVAH